MRDTTLFDGWLRAQRAYQRETYGVDYDDFYDAGKLTEYVTTNLYAATLELAEAAQETPWKPWATVDKEAFWEENRDRFVGELVDVLFFVANGLAAVGVVDRELNERYLAKMDVNRQRQAAGYDGTAKCTVCGRAFDDEHVRAVQADEAGTLCAQCA